MSADRALTDLYGEWHRLTEAEGQAISQAAWIQVAECQRAKAALVPRILEATSDWQTRVPPAGPARVEAERRLRAQVAGLIELEARNQQWLSRQYEQARLNLAALDQASSHLRQLHRAYAPSRASVWQSYS